MRDLKAVLDGEGTVASLNNIRFSIKSAGIRWRQARIALTSKDPDYRAKLEAIKTVLSGLSADEAFFSIDELGPVAVKKMRAGRSMQFPGQIRTVPQWQKSRGSFILTAALDLAKNQVIYFFSERKNTDETIRLGGAPTRWVCGVPKALPVLGRCAVAFVCPFEGAFRSLKFMGRVR